MLTFKYDKYNDACPQTKQRLDWNLSCVAFHCPVVVADGILYFPPTSSKFRGDYRFDPA